MAKKKTMANDRISDIKEMLDRLEALRKERNLNQRYLAQQLGIDKAAYIEKEAGVVPITIREWLKISDILEVKLIYFLRANNAV